MSFFSRCIIAAGLVQLAIASPIAKIPSIPGSLSNFDVAPPAVGSPSAADAVTSVPGSHHDEGGHAVTGSPPSCHAQNDGINSSLGKVILGK